MVLVNHTLVGEYRMRWSVILLVRYPEICSHGQIEVTIASVWSDVNKISNYMQTETDASNVTYAAVL